MKGWVGGGPVTTLLIQLTELLVRMEKSLYNSMKGGDDSMKEML